MGRKTKQKRKHICKRNKRNKKVRQGRKEEDINHYLVSPKIHHLKNIMKPFFYIFHRFILINLKIEYLVVEKKKSQRFSHFNTNFIGKFFFILLIHMFNHYIIVILQFTERYST